MVGHRRRSSSVVSNIALNIPVLELNQETDQHNGFVSKETHLARSKSFSIGSESNPIVEETSSTTLDPFNIKEKRDIWKSQYAPYKAHLDVSFDDYVLLNDDEFENDFLNQLHFIKNENNKFISHVDSIVKDLDHFLEINQEVTNETSEFRLKSNNLIRELDDLQHVHDGLADKLRIFESLDTIVTRLNKSNSYKSVIRSSFHDEILVKLDDAIKFVNDESHQDYKELDVFRYRFKQCLIRALSLIRNYLIKTIRNIEDDTLASIQELEDKTSSVLINAIIHTKFSESMTLIYSPFVELYKRSFNNDEASNLLEDVYNQYQKSRGNLVKTYIIDLHMNSTKPNDELLHLCQTNLSFFSKVLDRELETFEKSFFLPSNQLSDTINNNTNVIQMHKFFENILDPLYYLLRNKVIRENNIGTLCDLIDTLQSYSEKSADEDGYITYVTIDYDLLLKPILADVQTRLVFRVQIYAERYIVNYRKTGRELIIENRKEGDKKEPVKNCDDDDAENLIDNLELGSIPKLIYPPIVKAVKLLTRIYTLVKQPVFDVLTASIVHLSILSLENNFGNQSDDLNTKLYQMGSLIWFKDSINMFDIEHVRKETNLDFSGLRNLFSRFTNFNANTELKSNEHESLFNALWGSIPTVVNDFIDCRIELQIELRNVVHEFIDISSGTFVSGLRKVIDKINQKAKITNKEVSEAVTQFRKSIEDDLPRFKIRVKEFIQDERVFEFLLDGIQNVIIKVYGDFYNDITQLSERDETQYGGLIAEIMELDEVNKLWAENVKKLFLLVEENDDLQLTDEDELKIEG